LSGDAWERAIEVVQVLHALLIFVFVLRHTGRRAHWLEAGLWCYWAAGSAYVMLAAHRALWVERWYLGTLAASLVFGGLLIQHAWRQRRSEAVLLALAALTSITLSGYDLWLFSQHTWTDRLYLAHYGAPLFMFALGWVLMRRFVASLNAYETLNAGLEQRIADKAEELEQRHGQLAEARRSEAVAVERARIMSEMHDGIGSQLTMALSLVERGDATPGRVAAVLHESIEDLQLIIDSLEPVDNDLLTVLGMLRYRVQDRLQRCGIEIRWQVNDLPALPLLTPQNVLAILRILQEAFVNSLKHSGARWIEVSTALEQPGSDAETVCILIADDGRGMDGAGHLDHGHGRGLDSMRRRAKSIGGTLDIESHAGGTRVSLRLRTDGHTVA
jgi:signal transduction histidine kinase